MSGATRFNLPLLKPMHDVSGLILVVASCLNSEAGQEPAVVMLRIIITDNGLQYVFLFCINITYIMHPISNIFLSCLNLPMISNLNF